MPSLSMLGYHRVVRASAVYDALVIAPFATPWSFALLRDQLSALNQAMGGQALPAFDVLHILIACLLGNLALVWSVLKLLRPSLLIGRCDGVARGLFAVWMLWAWSLIGAPVLWLFLLSEVAWGVVQWLPVAEPADTASFSISKDAVRSC